MTQIAYVPDRKPVSQTPREAARLGREPRPEPLSCGAGFLSEGFPPSSFLD